MRVHILVKLTVVCDPMLMYSVYLCMSKFMFIKFLRILLPFHHFFAIDYLLVELKRRT